MRAFHVCDNLLSVVTVIAPDYLTDLLTHK